MYSYSGISGIFSWEKTPGQTQKKLEGLYAMSGLGMPWDLPRGTKEQCRRKEHLLSLLLI